MRISRNHAQGTAPIVISKLARPAHPVYQRIAENLGKIDVMRIVKITPGFLQASSEVIGVRASPVTAPGHPTAIGISLILDEDYKDIQFYEITSAVKGFGSQIFTDHRNPAYPDHRNPTTL